MTGKNTAVRLFGFYLLVILVAAVGIGTGNRVVTTMSESLQQERSRCIIIDAGHGGEDGGAISYSGRKEADYNLAIAIRTNNLFRALGYKTHMIRMADVSVAASGKTVMQRKVSDLKERTTVVNAEENGILISIHQNYFTDERYTGAQVFYNSNSDSKMFAEQMQKELKAVLDPGNNRKIKRGEGIYLLEKTDCPGVLVECGFISNEEEEKKIRTEWYQKKIAGAICVATAAFLSNT